MHFLAIGHNLLPSYCLSYQTQIVCPQKMLQGLFVLGFKILPVDISIFWHSFRASRSADWIFFVVQERRPMVFEVPKL